MTKFVAITQKSKFFLSQLILLFLIFNSSMGRVQAQVHQEFWQLADGSLAPELWESVLGDWDQWQVVEGRLHGLLPAPPMFSGTRSAITPRFSLWPVTGNYQFSFDFTPLDTADKNFGVLFDYYIDYKGKVILSYLSFHFIDQQVYIETFQRNFLTHKTLVPWPLNPGETYHFRLIFQQPDFILYVNDQLLFSSANDQDFWPIFLEPGRPLFYLTKGNYDQSAVIYSNFVLEYYPQLLVTYFSQLHASWAEVVYDHTQEFFNPALTIGNSGCALTSAVMLLHYYGFDTFPDQESWSSELRGKTINPETLNLWLKSEADGYLGVGLVNWLAITRLTKLLSQSVANKQFLAFAYADYQPDLVSEELGAGRPVIADLDGHFVVITGMAENGDHEEAISYLINDPVDSEHTMLDPKIEPIQSLRLFKRNQTDLSYFLLLSAEELDFKLMHVADDLERPAVVAREANLLEANLPEANLPEVDLPEANSPEANQDYFLYYWPQPENGEYLWQFEVNDLAKLPRAQLFVYQRDAQLQIFNLADYVARELNFVFSKDQLAELAVDLNQHNLLFYHQYLLARLLKLQREQELLGEVANANRYQQLIEYFLDFYQL